MSSLSATHQDAFLIHLEKQGEPLTFRGAALRGLVLRTPAPGPRERGELTFRPDDSSEIHLPAIGQDPKSGEYFTDGFGFFHYVQSVKRAEARTICYCTSNQAP